jgi:sialate O-acetylesterase
MLFRVAVPFVALAIFTSAALADVRPHALISDGMVLQQGRKVPVWGSAAADEKVTIRFRGQEVQTIADGGRWSVLVESGTAGGPFPMTIAGKNTLALPNVLVGEVWVCGGQSNMGWPFAPRPKSPQLQGTEQPALRLFNVPARFADARQSEPEEARWLECGPETLGPFSAVAYFFGRDLQRALKVPVGLIHASYGGSGAGQWISTSAPAGQAEMKADLAKHRQLVEDAARAKPELDKYRADLARAKKEGKPPPPRPRATPAGPAPGSLYNGMIAPLQPFAIRGAIWYQGEANVNNAARYRTLFPALIQSWRQDWGQGNFPFLLVQIAPYGKIVGEPQESKSAELREAQLLTSQNVAATGMAVVSDWGHELDIHPLPKYPAGERLALLARGLVYGEKVVYSGPLYQSMTTEGNKAILTFRHVGTGLEAKTMVLEDVKKDRQGQTGGALHAKAGAGQKLTGFTVRGEGGPFVNAQAEIAGATVHVWSPAVPRPVAVRYGWADYPTGNLFNREGLPAAPFRSDGPQK